MTLIPFKTPAIAKKMFPNYIWDIESEEKDIYLTFDDGPTEDVTDWVLDQLRAYNAKATFFCIGANVESNPEIFKKIIQEGHSIGNHTHNHLKGWKTTTENYLKNVETCEQILKSTIFNSNWPILNPSTENHKSPIADQQSLISKLFRPPYGKLKPKQGKQLIQLGYKIIMWDILSFDWDQKLNAATCYQHIISKAENGSIIVFHDSKKASKNMKNILPKVLEYFSRKGFQFKAIPN